MGENNAAAGSGGNTDISEVSTIIRSWEEHNSQENYDPLPTLTRLAEICEIETENYLKMDPDPFDERHPSRSDPDCKLGQTLKVLFRKNNFLNKLVNNYMRETYYTRLGITGRSIDQLNIAACRLMLDVMPGLDPLDVFQPEMDALIQRLIHWTTNSIEPLQTYATGVLASAMEVADFATRFREENARLVPLLLQRLHRLQYNHEAVANSTFCRPFAHLERAGTIATVTQAIARSDEDNDGGDGDEPQTKRIKLASSRSPSVELTTSSSPSKLQLFPETSNSSWAELETFMIGTVQIFPPTNATRQILILRYLTRIGAYQEFLAYVFENDALRLILNYINVRVTKEARLAFEALRYLAALLCHKKFSIEFIRMNGLQIILDVPRPSLAATGVSICLYYLAYGEEAMERISVLPRELITNLVKYALWLLECSHDSGRCQAIMFFQLTFQLKVILDEFDAQDGLRKMYNVIATLPILMSDTENVLSESQEHAARQIVRYVCVSVRRYLEAHLNAKGEQIRKRTQLFASTTLSGASCKLSPVEVQEQCEMLMEHLPLREHWPPVEQLLKLGGVTLLLKIIAFAYEWNYSGRGETVRCALDALAIACIMPRVQLLLCEKVDIPMEFATVGLNIVLNAAEGDIVADVEVQKAALRVIINCVCGPVNRSAGQQRISCSAASCNNTPVAFASPQKLRAGKLKSREELIEKVWDCVRSNNGIMVLLQLMHTKMPVTDADCIRMLACKALAGLTRSDTVRQIVSNLKLFNGQMQNLMRDPVLQEKSQEHVKFQKYALELLVYMYGNTEACNQNHTDFELSLENWHRAYIVSQTKVRYSERQLLQLIQHHLMVKGLHETANALGREAGLNTTALQLFPAPLQQSHSDKCHSYSASTKVKSNSCIPIHRTVSSPSTLTPFASTGTTHTHAVSTGINSPGVHLLSHSSVVGRSNSNSLSPSTIKLIKKNAVSHMMISMQSSRPSPSTSHVRTNPVEMMADGFQPVLDSFSIPLHPRVTLDTIVKEYLTNQHALCKNPVAMCPQFNLFVPHKCPESNPRIISMNNCVVRCAYRSNGTLRNRNFDRRFVHTRFCSTLSIRCSDRKFFTCAAFVPGSHRVIVGNSNGEVHEFNIHNGNEETMFQPHEKYIAHVAVDRTGSCVLTSATWGRHLSALWSRTTDYQLLFAMDDEDYVEYSKLRNDRVLATRAVVATIYDVNTCQEVQRFIPTVSNQYTKNRATYSPHDDLVLSDGVLFDVASGKQIHKLDKLNQTQSGVFHPNGLEIVANTEVWDLRTFHLLRTAPALDRCSTRFPTDNTLYAFCMEQDLDNGDTAFDTSFKTIDAGDYSSIATIDVKRNIYDLVVNRYDTQIAIVENQGMYPSVQESVVRLYDVGRRKDDETERDEEEEDDDDEDLDGSDYESESFDPVILTLNDDNIDDVNDEPNDDDEDDDDDDGDEEDDDDEDDEDFVASSESDTY